MSNSYGAGQLAKLLTKYFKNSKRFWSCFLLLFIVLFLFFGLYGLVLHYGDLHPYQVEQQFVKYERGVLTTNQDTYKILKDNSAVVKIENLLEIAEIGDSIHLTINGTTGRLLKIQIEETVVYRVSVSSTMENVICMILFELIFSGGLIFLLICINLKHPKKKFVRKIQKSLVGIYHPLPQKTK